MTNTMLVVATTIGCSSEPKVVRDAAPIDVGIDAPSEDVHFVGRFDAAHQFAWPGTQIALRFTGDSISVALTDTTGNDWFEASLDGARQPAFQLVVGAHVYPLASGLAAGNHDLVLARRTESFNGTTTFGGFSGATIVATPKPTRLVEFIGDSITCGYGDLGAMATCGFSPATESEPDAWGRLAADALGVAHVSIAYSGIGMLRNSDGSTANTMPLRYGRTIADDPNSVWGFSYAPDAIVINLGTNDFATGDPGGGYVSAYVAFIAMVKTKFPAVKILITTSPMLDGTSRTQARAYLDQVAAQTGVTVVEIAEQLASDGYGCDYHPNIVTQRKMADAIVVALRTATGW